MSTLHRIARDFLDGKSLPQRIGKASLPQWLDSLSRDQREFSHPDSAVALGVTTERPWIGEVATALRFRIEESTRNGAA